MCESHEEPGTPLGRLKGLAEYAIKAGLCSGIEAKPPELFLIEEIERLRAEVERLKGKQHEESQRLPHE